MTITVEFTGTAARIVLAGGIDYATQAEFKNAKRQALSAECVREIQVDFARANHSS